MRTESGAAGPVLDQVGFFVGQSGNGPAARVFEAEPFMGFPHVALDLQDIGHATGHPAFETPNPLAIDGCTNSPDCLKTLFPDLGGNADKVRAGVIASGNGAFWPACGIGAGIDTLAKAEGHDDLLGTARANGAPQMLGAAIRPASARGLQRALT